MGKVKEEMMARAGIAMMGFVTPCHTEEVNDMVSYIATVLDKEDTEVGVRIPDGLEVTHMVVNRIHGMNTIALLLDGVDVPEPFTEDYGTGFPSAFCYVLNLDEPHFSEFGDCFFTKTSDGFYHRVS